MTSGYPFWQARCREEAPAVVDRRVVSAGAEQTRDCLQVPEVSGDPQRGSSLGEDAEEEEDVQVIGSLVLLSWRKSTKSDTISN